MQTIFTRLFENAYDSLMHLPERLALSERRLDMLAGLTGQILEIGSGTGVNFPLYNSQAEVLAIEPSIGMVEQARKSLEQSGIRAKIKIVQSGVNDKPEGYFTGQFDHIVCTLVLCTIPHPLENLRRIRSWLKPGGRLHVLEHIAAKNSLVRSAQTVMNPVWSTLAGGCNLNRPTDQYLEEAGFVAEKVDYFEFGLPFIAGVYRSS